MLYSLITKLLKCFYKLFFLANCEGLENVPETGGCIICGNHKRFHDPLITAAFLNRQLKFLSKAELFKFKPFGWFLTKVGCVSVDRSKGDLKAMRTCLNLLKDGNALVLYPEGTRSCKHLEDVKPGAIMFAVKAKVPVVPVGISRLGLLRKSKVTFGKPVYYEEFYDKKVSNEEYRELVNKLMFEIFNMVDEKCCYYDEIKASVDNEH